MILHLLLDLQEMMLEDYCKGYVSVGDCSCWVDVIIRLAEVMITWACAMGI